MCWVDRIESGDSNEWLIFIHGFCGNSEMWGNQIDVFKRFYNILLIDLPGHGKSNKFSEIENLQDVVHILLEILEKENIKEANFIGTSLGSMIICEIINIKPHVVRKAILCDAVIVKNRLSKIVVRLVEKVQRIIPYRLILYIGNYILLPFKRHKLVRDFYNNSGRNLGQKEFNKWFSMIIENIDILKNVSYRKNTLFISGVEDFHFIKGVKLISKRQKAKLKAIDNCGHIVSMQKQEEFNNIVLDFLI